MLAAVFRRVLLSYASHFFTNVEVENLSLWSGTVAIENIDLNAKEVTAVLGLAGVQVTSGSLGRLELQVPWSSLTSASLEVTLKEVVLELELGRYQPQAQAVPPAEEAEESLMRKILANIKVKVENLAVVLRFKGSAQYCLKAIISNFTFGTTDRDWDYQFVNPFSLIEGGTAYRHHRLLRVQDLELRVIAGGKDDYLSNTVLGHRFESSQCKNCALCYAFKSSSFYTLASLKPCALDFYWYVSSEKTQLLKPSLLAYLTSTETSSMELRFTTPLQTRLCLVEEARVAKDLSQLLSTLCPAVVPKPLETLVQEQLKEDQSWLAWSNLFFPITFSASKQMSKSVRLTDGLLAVVVPQLQCQLKLFNPASLELGKVKVFTTELSYKLSSHRTETTDPDYLPSQDRDETEGSCHELLLYVYLKENYSLVRIACLRFGLQDSDVAFAGSDADVQVAMQGRVSKTIQTKALEGKIVCGTEVTIQTNMERMTLDFKPEEMIAFAEAMTELNLLYARIVQAESTPFPGFDSLQFKRQSSKTSEEQLQQAEETINQLKSALLAAHSQLTSTQSEVSRLRAALSSTVGGSLPALAGLLSIDQSSIKAVCLEALYNTYPVKAVLTATELIVLSQEGRQMHKVRVKAMVRLEEQGEEELQVHTQDQALRLMLRNRSDFVRGIQSVFGN